jgi:putative tryptophan/tyrosine transport system substrate-binding protein
MRRREFVAGLGGVAARPLAVSAQQAVLPVIGFLNGGGPSDGGAEYLAAFRQGLREERFVEGENVTIELRMADGQYDRLPALAMELLNRGVAVIAAGSPAAAQAAKAATSTIPIVFTSGGDALTLGLVTSMGRPGGNVTGISFLIDELSAKQLGLLHDLVPKASVIASLLNPGFVDASRQLKSVQDAARAFGLKLEVMGASTECDRDVAFARMVEAKAGGLVVFSDPFLFIHREKILALAAGHALPAIYSFRGFVAAGGLMSYDTSIPDAYRRAGVYVGRVLKGEKPADLPVVQPTKYEFVINLKTAKALGLNLPPTLLAIADEVIE